MYEIIPAGYRQSHKRSSAAAMDSDSDETLSNLASMDYLRREIAKLEKLVAVKTVGVHPSATSPAAAGRWLLPRIPAAGIVDSPAAATSSSAAGPRELRSPGRRLSSSRGIRSITNRRAGTICRASGYLGASIRNRELKSCPGECRAPSRTRSTGATHGPRWRGRREPSVRPKDGTRGRSEFQRPLRGQF